MYIAGIVVLVFVIATITTSAVLSLASSSDSGDSDSFMSTLHGAKLEANSESSANVVLIILDDAGWADFSFHNTDPWSAIQTPNIDGILRGGLSFSNFYTQAVCTPARGSMMTGRWTWALGLQHLINFKTCTDSRISWDIPTWGELLKEKDYQNFFYGKWHLGMNTWNSTARGRGWDGFLGNLNSDHESALGSENGKGLWVYLLSDWDCDMSLADQVITANTSTECMFRSYDYKYVKFNAYNSECRAFSKSTLETACTDLDLEDPNYSEVYVRREGTFLHLELGEPFVDWWRDYTPEDPNYSKRTDVVLTDEAVVKLEAFSNQNVEKWSIVLSYKTPHQDTAFLPYGTNTAIVKACERFFDESSKYYNYDRGAICQQMWQIDTQVGRIVTALKDLSLWDNTLILLTNDNGATSAQYVNASTDELNYNYGLNWPLRGVKSSYYQGAVKTIMGISGGALPEIQRGTVNTDLHHVSDIAPTILAAAGWSEDEMTGISNGVDFDGIPLYSTSTVSSSSHEYIFLSAPSFTGNSKFDDNITAIVLKSGLKQVSLATGEELNSKGYWGTLPKSKTIPTTWETCDEGCVWDLVNDPYEHVNLGGVVDQQVFVDLLDEAYASSSWNDGLEFNMASCEECSHFSDCSENTAEYYYGYPYYAPWL